MMKVVQFKKKSELPKDILYRIDNVAENYIGILFESMLRLGGIQPSDEDFDKINRIVVEAFEESLCKKIDEL